MAAMTAIEIYLDQSKAQRILAAQRELADAIADAFVVVDVVRPALVPAGTRLSGDDSEPLMRCSRGCNHRTTGRHEYYCAAYPPLVPSL